MGTRGRVAAVAAVIGGSLLLAACLSSVTGGSATPTTMSASAAASASLDCRLARAAMDDYSEALKGLAASLESGDAMAAVGAADALTFSLDQLERSLPGIPPQGQTFLATSRSVALQVKQSAADSPAMTGLVKQLMTSFSDPDFAVGGHAIDEYADATCPRADPSDR